MTLTNWVRSRESGRSERCLRFHLVTGRSVGKVLGLGGALSSVLEVSVVQMGRVI